MTPQLFPQPYGQLLEAARELGRADGRFARDLDLGNAASGRPATCRGRDPAGFAGHLWAGRAGEPPAGLEVNAPLWYAVGFAEGTQSSSASSPAMRAAPSVSTGR